MTPLQQDILRADTSQRELADRHGVSINHVKSQRQKLVRAGHHLPDRRRTGPTDAHKTKYQVLFRSKVRLGRSLISRLSRTQLQELVILMEAEGYESLTELCTELLLDYLAEKGKLS